MNPVTTIKRDDKYRIVASLLHRSAGSLLDVGARDCILRRHINEQRLDYLSADVAFGLDYQIDLEERLTFQDQAFNYVVALDVLEHVDRIHQALSELLRITRSQLILALPNMGTISRRWSFFVRSDLQTRKYDLLAERQPDRHRWLTLYAQMNAFVAQSAAENSFILEQIVEQVSPGPISGRVGLWGRQFGLFSSGCMTERCIYVLTRQGGDAC